MNITDTIIRFETLAGQIERGSAPGQSSEQGKRYARAGKCHADMVRSLCKDIKFELRQEATHGKNSPN